MRRGDLSLQRLFGKRLLSGTGFGVLFTRNRLNTDLALVVDFHRLSPFPQFTLAEQ